MSRYIHVMWEGKDNVSRFLSTYMFIYTVYICLVHRSRAISISILIFHKIFIDNKRNRCLIIGSECLSELACVEGCNKTNSAWRRLSFINFLKSTKHIFPPVWDKNSKDTPSLTVGDSATDPSKSSTTRVVWCNKYVPKAISWGFVGKQT